MQSKRRSNDEIFAAPLNVDNVADCYFYHAMEFPGHGVIEGRDWDLRGRVDEYSATSILPVNAFWKSVPPAVS